MRLLLPRGQLESLDDGMDRDGQQANDGAADHALFETATLKRATPLHLLGVGLACVDGQSRRPANQAQGLGQDISQTRHD